MRKSQEDKVTALAAASARRVVTEELVPTVKSAVEQRVTALPDVQRVARSVFDDGVRTSSPLRALARQEGKRAAEERVPALVGPQVEKALAGSTTVLTVVAEHAVQAAATETKRLLGGEYDAAMSALAERTAEETVRGYAERMIAEGALPRRIEVSAPTDLPRLLDGDTHQVLPDLLLALNAGCHVLLVGPAGTGKSTMAKQAAQGLGRRFHAMSVGPTTPTSRMFGFTDAHGVYHRTPLRDAYENGGLMLLDELDNGHPGLLAELNQALSLDVCAFPDGMIARHQAFRLVASANTYGHGADRQYVGRQALDAATLDRFVIIDVPVDEQMERRLVLAQAPQHRHAATRLLDEVRELRRIAAEKKLPVMFSPRASIHAARLLAAGATVDQARRWSIVRGLSTAHRAALGLA